MNLEIFPSDEDVFKRDCFESKNIYWIVYDGNKVFHFNKRKVGKSLGGSLKTQLKTQTIEGRKVRTFDNISLFRAFASDKHLSENGTTLEKSIFIRHGYKSIDKPKIYDDIHIQLENQVRLSLIDKPQARQARLRKPRNKPKKREVIIEIYDRNPDVIAEVLIRANGICEKCNNNAPFNRSSNNSPYLEVHHIIHLANGGDDSIENCLALCPNCHRELHFGKKPA